jgi:hypothetical protein
MDCVLGGGVRFEPGEEAIGVLDNCAVVFRDGAKREAERFSTAHAEAAHPNGGTDRVALVGAQRNLLTVYTLWCPATL